MDILYKHRWGIYYKGERIFTYMNEEAARRHLRNIQREAPYRLDYEVKQVSWLYED